MDRIDQGILEKYIPEAAVPLVIDLLKEHPCHLKIVKKRKTKHGDFRRFPDGKVQITINNEANPYRFLVTLIHEFAHLITYKRFKRVRPHGAEWKENFKRLMLPYLNLEVFPGEILGPLAQYLINPKASSDTDMGLSMAMREFDRSTQKSLIFEIPAQSKFHYNKKMFIKGEKRRTRYECTEVLTHRKYIFHPHAEVELIK